MIGDEYTCAYCGETHQKGWSDEEAKEEAKGVFGEDVFEREPVVIVCDDCYKLMGFDE